MKIHGFLSKSALSANSHRSKVDLPEPVMPLMVTRSRGPGKTKAPVSGRFSRGAGRKLWGLADGISTRYRSCRDGRNAIDYARLRRQQSFKTIPQPRRH